MNSNAYHNGNFRYHIHQMNVDAVMMCILPYHRTNIFVRMLQLLEIGDRSSKWNWLLQVQVKHPEKLVTQLGHAECFLVAPTAE